MATKPYFDRQGLDLVNHWEVYHQARMTVPVDPLEISYLSLNNDHKKRVSLENSALKCSATRL